MSLSQYLVTIKLAIKRIFEQGVKAYKIKLKLNWITLSIIWQPSSNRI